MFKTLTLKTTLPYILILASVVGIIASTILVYDQVKIWQNPSYIAPCSLNPILSCGSVMSSNQGHVFGIPAPFFGLVLFPVIGTLGLVLATGVKLKRWIWLSMQGAVTGGVLFALWLFWVSMYKINALCPYCLVTDLSVYAMAWYVTLYNIEQNYILKSERLKPFTNFLRKYHLDILVGLLICITALILHHFWYYYGRLF